MCWAGLKALSPGPLRPGRVSRAVRELRSHFLKWPEDDQQVAIADDIEAKSGLRLCIGSGDGSHVRQTAEPHEFGYMYRNRKHAFSVSNQIID